MFEYRRKTDRGLINQGWKDSWDGINFADGSLARAPIALAEVQAYTFAAYVARARLADEEGDAATAREWHHRATELKTAFNAAFWLADRGWFAIGLDADKRPIDALSSNIGHCLWTGIVDEDKAERVATTCSRPTCSSAGVFARWPRRWGATTRSAITTARSGRTTARSAWPVSSVTVMSTTPNGWPTACSGGFAVARLVRLGVPAMVYLLLVDPFVRWWGADSAGESVSLAGTCSTRPVAVGSAR